jgi:hypothetical protein
VSLSALPYVNWIFWGTLAGGTLLAMGLTEWRGGTTRGYRLFMAGTVLVAAIIWVLSEMGLVPVPGTDATAEIRRVLVGAFAVLALGYLVAVWRSWPRGALAVAVAGGAVGVAAVVSLALAGETEGALFAAGLVTAAVALGSVTAGMLLGHWYLVTPKLSPDPLRRLIWVLIGSLLAQGLLVAGSVAGGGLVEQTAWLTGLRFFVGVAFPLAIAVLALKATDATSMQSTTGLLYIGLAAVMAGTIGAASLVYLGWGSV